MDTEPTIDEEVKAEDVTSNETDSGKTMRSSLGLIGMLGALCLLYVIYPTLTKGLDKLGVKPASEGDTSEEVLADTAPVKQLPQAPEELKSWIPLVEAELPQREGIVYRLIHLRMSKDGAKLLVDLEKKSDGEDAVRFDTILVRDDFGRYVSVLNEVPMKLYPPDAPKEAK